MLGSSERFHFSAVAILNISCRHSKQFELTTNETVSMFDHSMYNHSRIILDFYSIGSRHGIIITQGNVSTNPPS